MGSSQHKSPHQARAFQRGLSAVASSEISPSFPPYPTMQYKFSRTNHYLKRQNQSEQWSALERVRDGLSSPYVSQWKQQHVCEKIPYRKRKYFIVRAEVNNLEFLSTYALHIHGIFMVFMVLGRLGQKAFTYSLLSEHQMSVELET